MNPVISALNENLKLIYRKAIDADNALDQLKKQGKGKFTIIFPKDAGFKTESKRFGPYVEEVAGEVAVLNDADKKQLAEDLPTLVKKIELLISTLERFKRTV